jgi:hypothetical protein
MFHRNILGFEYSSTLCIHGGPKSAYPSELSDSLTTISESESEASALRRNATALFSAGLSSASFIPVDDLLDLSK